MRPVALGRKDALFAGSGGGARHWATIATLIQTAKLNDVDPLAWLTDLLEHRVGPDESTSTRRTAAMELERGKKSQTGRHRVAPAGG